MKKKKSKFNSDSKSNQKLSKISPKICLIKKKIVKKKPKLYEVEEILGERKNYNNEQEFFVKWKNYPPEENSWEPFEHLDLCSDALSNFFDKKIKEKKIKNYLKNKINYHLISKKFLRKLTQVKKRKIERKYYKATNKFKAKTHIIDIHKFYIFLIFTFIFRTQLLFLKRI